jgi:F-type H+-transporting ATPase subunit delta
MKLNKQLKKQIDLAVRASFEDSQIDEKKVLVFTNLFKQLPEAILALTEYLKGIKRELNKTTLTIESSVELTQNEIKEIAAKLKKQYTIYNIQHTLNPSLLGGLRVKIGDMVLDDSVEAKIKEVRSAIAS